MKELVDFCESIALPDDLNHPVLGKKATQFFTKTLIPMIQRAHEAWPRTDIVEQTSSGGGVFQGRYFVSHVPSIFRDKVLAAAHRHYQKGAQMTLNGRVYRIHVVSLKRRSETFFRDVMYKMYLWLSVCSAFATRKECSQSLSVYLYLLPDQKVLPSNKDDHLRVENINTAFTRSCEPTSEINIFREEEWFKVLIHETFHNHGLDFSQHFDMYDVMVQQQLRACFPALKSPVLLFESYCELWGEVLHTLLAAFLADSKHTWQHFDHMWRIERIFSRLQCVKVLEHHGVTYDQLRDARFTFEERGTNAFAYYVVKCIMMHCGFLDWHLSVNGPSLRFLDANVGKMCTWICHVFRDAAFVKSLRLMERQDRVPSQLVKKTLRMVAN
jgi:hypothetical protein